MSSVKVNLLEEGESEENATLGFVSRKKLWVSKGPEEWEGHGKTEKEWEGVRKAVERTRYGQDFRALGPA